MSAVDESTSNMNRSVKEPYKFALHPFTIMKLKSQPDHQGFTEQQLKNGSKSFISRRVGKPI